MMKRSRVQLEDIAKFYCIVKYKSRQDEEPLLGMVAGNALRKKDGKEGSAARIGRQARRDGGHG
ncbi:hypothetical protein K0M31_001898 [Melipona bicolor]|uniref:Uncharacterized protein n=1 Tax=Melipona bicolor TaxID=60889 RepID=A0AA40GGG8_9HYME|nr:hypothetical protein K0M31_001898 [Melipona bicolor]